MATTKKQPSVDKEEKSNHLLKIKYVMLDFFFSLFSFLLFRIQTT